MDADLLLMDPDDQIYINYMTNLDPKDSHEQDHYRVIGLSQLRYQATKAQIKAACLFINEILLNENTIIFLP